MRRVLRVELMCNARACTDFVQRRMFLCEATLWTHFELSLNELHLVRCAFNCTWGLHFTGTEGVLHTWAPSAVGEFGSLS